MPAVSALPCAWAIYCDDPSSVASADVRFKVAMLVASETEPISDAGAAIEVLPACDAVCITIWGPYDNQEPVYSRLGAWVYQNDTRVADAPREVCMKCGESISPAEWITEIQLPVER